MRRAALAVWLLSMSCSCAQRPQPSAASDTGAKPERSASNVPAPLAQPQQPRVESAAAKPAVPGFRVVEAAGLSENVRIAGLGQRLGTAAGSAAIDLPNAARVRLEPSTRIVVLEFEPSTFVLVTGSVFVELLPEGNQPGRAALRLVTALGTLIVSNTAEVWAAQRGWPDANKSEATAGVAVQAQLLLLRGVGELAHVAAGGGVQSQPVVAGQTLPARNSQHGSPANLTLQDARRASAEFMRRRGTPVRLALATERLDRALEDRVAEQRSGAAIMERMARLVAQRTSVAARADAGANTSSGAELRAAQRELASHAQQKHLLRQRSLLIAEQSVLAQLAACAVRVDAGLDCPELSAWTVRYAAALAEGQAR